MITPIHVLLVEDNPGDAYLAKETLEASKILVDISVVVDGEQAIAYMLRTPPYADVKTPDLVLLDLNLPKWGGQEVLQEIKRHPSLRSIPVVILTSSNAAQDVLRSCELGASCYVTKPVGPEAFQAIVRNVDNFWITVVKLP